MRCPHRPLYRSQQPRVADRAGGDHLEDQRRPDVLRPAARVERGGRRGPHRQRLRQGSAAAAPDGVRGGSAETAGDQSGGKCWLTLTISTVNTGYMPARPTNLSCSYAWSGCRTASLPLAKRSFSAKEMT